jgi:hypothetical protein
MRDQWHRFLVWLGARAPTTMSPAQAVRAYAAGTMTLEQAAAACGLSVSAFRTQVRAAGFLVRQGARAGFALLPTGLGAVALLLVLGAAGVALHMASEWGKPSAPPVEAGWAMRYFIVEVGDGRIVSIRNEGASAGGKLRRRDFRHGGTSSERAPLRIVSREFGSADEATRALASAIRRGTLRRPPLAQGKQAVIGGRTVTIDDWGSVNMALLAKLVG